MKIAYIGPCSPGECGISTFTRNLCYFMAMNNKTTGEAREGFVIAMNDHELTSDFLRK